MSVTFHELLEASVGYLEELKKRGVRHVPVRRETLEGLADVRAPAELTADREDPAGKEERIAEAPDAGHRVEGAGAEPGKAGDVPDSGNAPEEGPGLLVREAAPLTARSKAEALAELRERALSCMKCPNLAAARRNVVFGVGNIDAELMFVGEAPGADEDAAGEPFVGKAGQLLTRIIETMGLSRGDVYIANILKCRPDTPGQSYGNRKPTSEEMKTCSPYLRAQIDLIRPKVLVALGATAVEGLLGKAGGITRLRGHWQEYRDTPLMPTYHPAYLLRNQALGEKRKVWEDMLAVMERLGLEISEKQRGYFLQK